LKKGLPILGVFRCFICLSIYAYKHIH
jgi:hypothetical protein